LCGTVAVISPVGEIDDHGKQIIFNEGKQEMDPKLKEIYDTLTGIQMDRLPAPEGWGYTIN
jgi:branched-chain amino acid aminotransferase